MTRHLLAVGLLVAWAFYYWPSEMLYPIRVVRVEDVRRAEGFDTLWKCERAATILERRTRWAVMATPCFPVDDPHAAIPLRPAIR